MQPLTGGRHVSSPCGTDCCKTLLLRFAHVHMLSTCATCHTYHQCYQEGTLQHHATCTNIVNHQSEAVPQRKFAAMTATDRTVWELQDNVVYSGADDCMFKGWDMRTAEAHPTFVNRQATHVCF